MTSVFFTDFSMHLDNEQRYVSEAEAAEKGGDDVIDNAEKRSMRPATARRRPPKLKEAAQEVPPSREQSKAATVGIILDGDSSDDDDDDDENAEGKNDDDDLAGMKRLGSNTEVPMAKRDRHGKLVQELLRQQEQDVAQAKDADSTCHDWFTLTPEICKLIASIVWGGVPGKAEDGGVKESQDGGIRLGRLKKTGEKHKPTVATFDEQDIQKIKNGVQNVAKAAAPLGKCMDYIPDDLSKCCSSSCMCTSHSLHTVTSLYMCVYARVCGWTPSQML